MMIRNFYRHSLLAFPAHLHFVQIIKLNAAKPMKKKGISGINCSATIAAPEGYPTWGELPSTSCIMNARLLYVYNHIPVEDPHKIKPCQAHQ